MFSLKYNWYTNGQTYYTITCKLVINLAHQLVRLPHPPPNTGNTVLVRIKDSLFVLVVVVPSVSYMVVMQMYTVFTNKDTQS